MVSNPNSNRKSDIAYALHPYTNLAAHEEQGPLVITQGDGIYVWDDKGNQYLEGLAGLWCVSLGFSETRLADAAARQFADLPLSLIHISKTSTGTRHLLTPDEMIQCNLDFSVHVYLFPPITTTKDSGQWQSIWS